MLAESLINEAHIHVGSASAASASAIAAPGPVIADAPRWRLIDERNVAGDTHRVYRKRD